MTPTPRTALALFATLLAAGSPARADDRWEVAFPGVRHLHRVTGSQNLHVLLVDLCAAGVSARGTRIEESGRTVAAHGAALGAQAVVNGDFYNPSNPRQLDGPAMGAGALWGGPDHGYVGPRWDEAPAPSQATQERSSASPPGPSMVPGETPTKAMEAGPSPVVLTTDTPARSEAQNEEAKEVPAMRTVALDLGVRKICLCEVSDGAVVRRVTARSLKDLDPLLGEGTAPARVAFEACREAWHVHDVLKARGHMPILIDTTRVQRIGVGQHGAKTDRRDAEVLARALERGDIPVAHVLSTARRHMRDELCTRGAMVETRAQYITTLRGLARAHGVMLPSCSAEAFVKRVRGAALPPELLLCIEPVLGVMDALESRLAEVETRLETLARGAPEVALLATVPGVGLIVAATFVAALDDAGRFPDAHAVEAYLGLVPCENSSGGRRRLGAITKQGNPWARNALVQAAHVILRTAPDDDPLKVWALTVQERRGKMIAVIALARRLAGVLWAMWRRRRSYDPCRLAARSAAGLEQASEEKARQADEQSAIARAEHKIFPRTRARRGVKSPRSRGVASTEEVTGR